MIIRPDRVSLWFDYVRYQNHLSQRFADCFFPSQLKSKQWLLQKAETYLPGTFTKDVVIFGGWYGILAGLIVDNLFVNRVITVDKDPDCEKVVGYVTSKTDDVKAVTCDMVEYKYYTQPGLIINTSCEHITQEEFEKWWNNVPINTYYILQSNNFKIAEHIRIAESLDHFVEQSNVTGIIAKDELNVGDFTRYMIIGRKNG